MCLSDIVLYTHTFLALVYIRGCSSFNITVTNKISTNNSHLWSCVCQYQFLALYNKSSSQSNYISKCSIFLLSVQSAVIFIHRSHIRLKTFKLHQTEIACLIVLKAKLTVNRLSLGSYKTKQVKSSINFLPLCSKRAVCLLRCFQELKSTISVSVYNQ